jgi:hypothetical protein
MQQAAQESTQKVIDAQRRLAFELTRFAAANPPPAATPTPEPLTGSSLDRGAYGQRRSRSWWWW